MQQVWIPESLSLMEKLNILSDAAKYDVACTSSGVDRGNNGRGMGNAISAGICHSFSADGRCISLLKILFTNECIYNCRYCLNRVSNYIEGLFLSSGILKNPNYTMELLYQTLHKLRREYHFGGYIHVKAIPGADGRLIEKTGYLADRMSVNLELPPLPGRLASALLRI